MAKSCQFTLLAHIRVQPGHYCLEIHIDILYDEFALVIEVHKRRHHVVTVRAQAH